MCVSTEISWFKEKKKHKKPNKKKPKTQPKLLEIAHISVWLTCIYISFRIVVANSLYVSQLSFIFFIVFSFFFLFFISFPFCFGFITFEINHFSMLYVNYWASWDTKCNFKLSKCSLEYVKCALPVLELFKTKKRSEWW